MIVNKEWANRQRSSSRCIISYRAENISCGAHCDARETYIFHSTSDPFMGLLGSYSARRFTCSERGLMPAFPLGLSHRSVIRTHRRSVSRLAISIYSPTRVPTISLEKVPTFICLPVVNMEKARSIYTSNIRSAAFMTQMITYSRGCH